MSFLRKEECDKKTVEYGEESRYMGDELWGPVEVVRTKLYL